MISRHPSPPPASNDIPISIFRLLSVPNFSLGFLVRFLASLGYIINIRWRALDIPREKWMAAQVLANSGPTPESHLPS